MPHVDEFVRVGLSSLITISIDSYASIFKYSPIATELTHHVLNCGREVASSVSK